MEPECWGSVGWTVSGIYQEMGSQKMTEVRVVSRLGTCLSNCPLVVRRSGDS